MKNLLIISLIVSMSQNATSQIQDTIFLKNDSEFLNSIDLNEDTNIIEYLALNTFEERFAYLNKNTNLNIDYNEVTYHYVNKYLKYKWIAKIIGLSNYYFPLFEAKLSQYGVPPELKYLAVVESNLNPRAVSSVGASGLWQFMPETGYQYGLHKDNSVNLFYDPVASSDASARYLKDLYNEFKDWNLAISAYNCGQGRIRSLIKKHKTKDYWKLRPYMPRETQAYVPTFIAINYIFNFYKEHKIKPTYFKYTFFDLSILKTSKSQSFKNESHFNFFNPHLLKNTIPKGVHYYKVKSVN